MIKLNQREYQSISLPRLNGLSPNLIGTALKLQEEAGELAQCIGKFRGMSGENTRISEETVIEEIAKELLDVAQTTVTMMFVLKDTMGVDIDSILEQHLQKLQKKGYII